MGSRKSLIVNFPESSASENHYGSIISRNCTSEENVFTPVYINPSKNNKPPKKPVEVSVLGPEDENGNKTTDKTPDKNNPFDRESFKRREKHATFNGRSRSSESIDPFQEQKEILSTFKRRIPEDNPQSSETPELPRPEERKTRSRSNSTNNSKRSSGTLSNNVPLSSPRSRTPSRTDSNQNDSLTRSLDQLPSELLINPEYRRLLDTATRHIRILAHQKKAQENDETFPANSVLNQNPTEVDDEFVSVSEDDFEYDGGSPGSVDSNTSSADTFPTVRILQNLNNTNTQKIVV